MIFSRSSTGQTQPGRVDFHTCLYYRANSNLGVERAGDSKSPFLLFPTFTTSISSILSIDLIQNSTGGDISLSHAAYLQIINTIGSRFSRARNIVCA